MKILRLLLLVAVLAHWGAMIFLTHTRHPPQVGAGDKTLHFTGYAAFGVLVYLNLWATWPSWRWIPVLTLIIAAAYGAIDERTQPFFGRTCDSVDWMADVAGAAMAVATVGVANWIALQFRPPSIPRE